MAQWKSRKGESVKDSDERVYFFKKAYEEFVSSASDDFPTNLMVQVEKELGISHTPEFDALTKSHKNVDASDSGRLCELIKSGAHNPLLQEMSKDALNRNEGQAFIDLCVLLGEKRYASLFAEQHNKQYDILEYVKHTSASNKATLMNEAARIFMECSPENRDAARLTGIVFSCVESAPDHKNLALSELWSEGYHWDAYCLATLLCPEARNTTVMRTRLEKFVQPIKSGKVHKIVELLELMKRNGSVGYKDQLLQDVDPIQLYRILKMDMIRNEKSKNNELQKLEIRGQNSEALRRVIFTAFVRASPSEAYTIAHDALHFIRNQGEVISDYFKGPERLLFETTVGIIGNTLEALNLLLHNKTSQMFANAGDNTVLDTLRNCWNKLLPDIFSENGQLHRDAFMRSADLFTPALRIVKEHMGRNGAKNEAQVHLAIKLASILLNSSLQVDKSQIAAAGRECGFMDDQIEKIFAGLCGKVDDAVFEEPVVSDGGVNFKEELQSSGIETNWTRSEVNDMSQITASGDTMEVGQEETDSRTPSSFIAQAKILVGNDNIAEIEAKEAEASRSTEKDQTEDSSASSVTGSAINYVHNEPDAPVQPPANIAESSDVAKPMEKQTPIVTPVQAAKPSPPKMQFASGGFEDDDLPRTFGKVPELAAATQAGFGPRSFGGPREHKEGGFSGPREHREGGFGGPRGGGRSGFGGRGRGGRF